MNWQTISIFISSTFKDMHSERDVLVKKVFPQLREKLLPYRIKIIDIDLRWGITEEQAENDKTIEFCLNSIEGCRPFFLGILGERYGWIPEINHEKLNDKFPNLKISNRTSITAMEIFHGVLSQNLEDKHTRNSGNSFNNLLSGFAKPELFRHNALFFFRDSEFENSMPEVLIDIVQSESPEHLDKLNQLKENIRKFPLAFPVVENYPCSFGGLKIDWDLLQEEAPDSIKNIVNKHIQNGIISAEVYLDFPHEVKLWLKGNSSILLTNLDEFAEKVSQNLWQLLCLEFPELLHDPISETNSNAMEDDEHHRFSDEITNLFVGREEILDEINDRLQDLSNLTPIVITGSAGTGKSALHAKAVKEWEKQNPEGQAIVHFSGVSLLGDNVESLYGRLIRLLGNISGLNIPQNTQKDFLSSALLQIIEKISPQKKILIAIDGLDTITKKEGLDLRWIPEKLKENVSVLLTISDDLDNSNLYLNQLVQINSRFLQIPALKKEERMQLIRQLPALSAKTMDVKHVQLLSDHPAANLPLFLTIALEELRMFGSYERLEKRIHAFPVETGKEGLELLYGQVLQRLERELGKENIIQPLSFLACSVTGLKESEIIQLCSEIPSSRLALLWRELRVHLHSKNGMLNFYHSTLKDVILKTYLSGRTEKHFFHAQLANYFKESAEKKRAIPELLEHYYICNEAEEMKKILSDWENFLMMRKEMPDQYAIWWDRAGVSEPLELLYQSICSQLGNYTEILDNNQGIELGFWAPQYESKNILLYNPENDIFIKPLLENRKQDALIELIRLSDQFSLYNNTTFFLRLKILAIFEKEFGPVHSRTLEVLASALPTILAQLDFSAGQIYTKRILLTAGKYLPPNHPIFINLRMHIQQFMIVNNQSSDLNENYNELITAFQNNTPIADFRELEQDQAMRQSQRETLKAIIMTRQSQLLRANGKINEAARLCQETVNYTETKLGALHELTIQALNNLAMIHMETMGDFEFGEKVLKETLTRSDARIGKYTGLGLTLINNLSASYGTAGKYVEGLPLYREALERKKIVLGKNNSSTLHSMYNLAYCLSEIGEYEEAESHCRAAVDGFLMLGKGFENYAVIMQIHLSDILQKAKKMSEAELVFEQAVDQFNEIPDSEKEWSTYYMFTTHMADQFEEYGQEEKALEIYWEQLGRLKNIEDASTHFFRLFNKMKDKIAKRLQTLNSNNQNEEVLSFTKEMIKLYEFVYDQNHPDLLHWKSELGEVLLKLEKYEEAENLLRDVVEHLEKIKGKEAPETRIAISFLAKTLMKLGNTEEAGSLMMSSIQSGAKRKMDTESICIEIIAKAEQEYGLEHPKTIQALDESAVELQKEHQTNQSIKYFRLAYERSVNSLGPLDEATLRRGGQLAKAYIETENYKDAEFLLRRILDAYEKNKGLSATDTLNIRDKLAEVLIKMEEFAEARSLLEKNVEIKTANFGGENLSTLYSIARFIQLYKQLLDEKNFTRNLELLYESLSALSEPEAIKTLTINYLESACHEKKVRISNQVQIIQELQKAGRAEYLGSNLAELEKTADQITQNFIDPEHPEGTDEIIATIGLLNQMNAHKVALDIWESFCDNFEKILEDTDPAYPMFRYALCKWLIDNQFAELAKEHLNKIWAVGDLKSWFVQKTGQILFNLIAYDADHIEITKVADQMIFDFSAIVDPAFPELQFFKIQVAAYFMQNNDFQRTINLYTEVLQQIPPNAETFINELKANLGEALAKNGNLDDGLSMCQDAWNFFESNMQKASYFVHVACSLANCLEIKEQLEPANELRKFAVKYAGFHLDNAFNGHDFTTILSQILNLSRFAEAAEKIGDYNTLNNALSVISIVQRRVNHITNMNETLWQMIGNLQYIENQKETFSFVVNAWEQTEQTEMLERLKNSD
jgi:hypothetical protein